MLQNIHILYTLTETEVTDGCICTYTDEGKITGFGRTHFPSHSLPLKSNLYLCIKWWVLSQNGRHWSIENCTVCFASRWVKSIKSEKCGIFIAHSTFKAISVIALIVLSVFFQYNEELHYVEPCLNGTLVQADVPNKDVSLSFLVSCHFSHFSSLENHWCLKLWSGSSKYNKLILVLRGKN